MADTYVAVARTPRGIIRHFTVHEADAPERAMGFNPTEDSEIALFRALQAQGVIRQASPKLFYVDPARLAVRQAQATTRVLSVAGAAGAVMAGLVALRSRRRRKAQRA